jgi:hypothetical protein
MRPIPSTRFAVLALTAGLSLLLVAPVAGQTEEPVIDPAPVVLPTTGHVLGSGGLGSLRSAHLGGLGALSGTNAPSRQG